MTPFDLHGLTTYDLASRPSKVFVEELGSVRSATSWRWRRRLAGRPAARIGRARRSPGAIIIVHFAPRRGPHHCRRHSAALSSRPAVALFDRLGTSADSSSCLALNAHRHIPRSGTGSWSARPAKTWRRPLPEGRFGMARETADAFALAALRGATRDVGLGAALGAYLAAAPCLHPEVSLLLAAHRAGIPCTVHVALGTDVSACIRTSVAPHSAKPR